MSIVKYHVQVKHSGRKGRKHLRVLTA